MARISNTTTATNYAKDLELAVPVHPDVDGPFLQRPQRTLPPRYILTKTHCGGYCDNCSNVDLTVDEFEVACATGQSPTHAIQYPSWVVQKVVHLVRSPLDNVVARQHNDQKRHAERNDLREWCLERSQNGVLCGVEFAKYVHWHNRALEMIRRRFWTAHVVRYESYTTDWQGTVDGLLEYLELPRVNEPAPFAANQYNHFSLDEQQAIAGYIQRLATPECWEMLKPYFAHLQVAPAPDIAWLLSFPNSGTSYTMMNVARVSNTTTATNYAGDYSELVPVRDAKGPFWTNPHGQHPDRFVLTKTHCGGYCEDCSTDRYTLTTRKFEQACATAQTPGTKGFVELTYAPAAVQRVVHLVRDPFDNLVARMHLGIKRRRNKLGWSDEELAKFSPDRDGLMAWCTYIDSRVKHRVEIRESPVPCASEWFKYVQWHNHAVAMIKSRAWPVHNLRYESYSDDYDATVQGLLDFLALPRLLDPVPFVSNKTYHHYFSEVEARQAMDLVRSLATDDCWALLQPYFRPWAPERF